MVKDRNKGISSITYNHLNLPTQIEFEGTNNKITYLYNAAGQKLKKTVVYSDSIKIVDYLDGFQYAGGELNFFPHPEGYVSVKRGGRTAPDGSQGYVFNYVYNYTDHLGNIRVSYSKDPQTNQLKILEENHYYPFGLKHSVYSAGRLRDFEVDSSNPEEERVFLTPVTKTEYQYKYNGQEWQDELGLNMYAMDLRQYDPAIARWVVQDPIVHHSMSPYNSFDNNPVFWADPSGADSQNESPQTTGVTLAFGVSLDSVIRSGAAIDFSGNLQSTGKGSKITLTGKNKNTVTFNIGGSTSYAGSVPFDIEENILLDINSVLEGFNPDNFAVGFTIGLSANAAAALGVEGSASLSVIRYFNDTYGGYNYFYTQTELTGYDGAIK